MPPIKVVGKPIGVTSNVDPAPMMYIFLTTPYTSPFKGMVYRAGIYTYHADIYLYLVFDSNFKISYVLIGQKQDVVNVFLSICHRPPTNPVGASDATIVVNNSEIQMEFCGNFVFNSLDCRSDFFFLLQSLYITLARRIHYPCERNRLSP